MRGFARIRGSYILLFLIENLGLGYTLRTWYVGVRDSQASPMDNKEIGRSHEQLALFFLLAMLCNIKDDR